MCVGMDDLERDLRDRDASGDAAGSRLLGDLLAGGDDLEGAEAAYRRAAEHGDVRGATNLGLLREHHGDLSGAERAYRRADEQGDKLGAERLGLLLGRRGAWKLSEAAWDRAAARPDPVAGELDLVAVLGRHDKAEVPLVEYRPPPLAQPVLIGAVTVLIVLLGVFLAYSANQGLPFVPTRELKVDIADGSQLTVGNDVREGGYRVGFVSDLQPVQLPGGATVAQLTLKLIPVYGRLPEGSHVEIRARSVLGLKYVDLIKGEGTQLIPDGGTLPIEQTTVPVQFDQIFDTFDPKTRRAIKRDFVEFGDTLAGRGEALSATVASLPALLRYLTPVARYLSAPATRLTGFIDAIDRFTKTVAPVAGTAARMFSDAATTFAAITQDPAAYQATLEKSPDTVAVSTDSLHSQLPLLEDLTTFGTRITPATVALAGALPHINPALEAGIKTLRRTPPLNRELRQVMNQLKALALAPGTDLAVNALTSTVKTLNPMIRYLGPFVTVCNDWNYWWTNLADHVSELTNFGTAQRVLFMLGNPAQPDNVSVLGATSPASGGGTTSLLGGDEIFHSQNYGAAIDRQGNADCETGQRGFPTKLNYFDPRGRDLATDQHTPSDQGPTFAGRLRVPAGETFGRSPQTGPQPLFNPSNP